MATGEQFGAFIRGYKDWQALTQALPFQNDPNMVRGAFEISLDHLISFLRPVFAAAAQRSTKLDYPGVAAEYLGDLNRVKLELGNVSVPLADRRFYEQYLAALQGLIETLGSLPVPPEGHLGFRKHALHAFGFLTAEYAFATTAASPLTVLFEARAMFVKLSHSPDCPADGLLVGSRVDGAPTLSGFILDDFAYAAGLGVQFDYEQFDLLSRAGVADFLDMAAYLLRLQGDAVLRGDPEGLRAFQAMAEDRERSYVEMMERESGQS